MKKKFTKAPKVKKPKLAVPKSSMPKFGRQPSPRGGPKMPKMPGAGNY